MKARIFMDGREEPAEFNNWPHPPPTTWAGELYFNDNAFNVDLKLADVVDGVAYYRATVRSLVSPVELRRGKK